MNKLLLENIVKSINTELKNGLISVEIESDNRNFVCYKPIDIDYDGNMISIYIGNDRIRVHHKTIDSIKIVEL